MQPEYAEVLLFLSGNAICDLRRRKISLLYSAAFAVIGICMSFMHGRGNRLWGRNCRVRDGFVFELAGDGGCMRDRVYAFCNRSRDLVCDQAQKKGYLAVSSLSVGGVCDGDAYIAADDIHCRQ